jgi:hypothetical protein
MGIERNSVSLKGVLIEKAEDSFLEAGHWPGANRRQIRRCPISASPSTSMAFQRELKPHSVAAIV